MDQSKKRHTRRSRQFSGSIFVEDHHQRPSNEEACTPEGLISTVCVQEATSVLNKLQIVDSP